MEKPKEIKITYEGQGEESTLFLNGEKSELEVRCLIATDKGVFIAGKTCLKNLVRIYNHIGNMIRQECSDFIDELTSQITHLKGGEA